MLQKLACGVNGCSYFHHKILHATKKDTNGKEESESSEHIDYQEEAMASVCCEELFQ